MKRLKDEDGNEYEVLDNNYPTDLIVVRPAQSLEPKFEIDYTPGEYAKLNVDIYGTKNSVGEIEIVEAIKSLLEYIHTSWGTFHGLDMYETPEFGIFVKDAAVAARKAVQGGSNG